MVFSDMNSYNENDNSYHYDNFNEEYNHSDSFREFDDIINEQYGGNIDSISNFFSNNYTKNLKNLKINFENLIQKDRYGNSALYNIIIELLNSGLFKYIPDFIDSLSQYIRPDKLQALLNEKSSGGNTLAHLFAAFMTSVNNNNLKNKDNLSMDQIYNVMNNSIDKLKALGANLNIKNDAGYRVLPQTSESDHNTNLPHANLSHIVNKFNNKDSDVYYTYDLSDFNRTTDVSEPKHNFNYYNQTTEQSDDILSKLFKAFKQPNKKGGNKSKKIKGTRKLYRTNNSHNNLLNDDDNDSDNYNTSVGTTSDQLGRLINRQIDTIHDEVLEKIKKIMKVDDDVARDYKSGLWNMLKTEDPDFNSKVGLDKAIQLRDSTTKENLKKINLDEAKNIRQKNKQLAQDRKKQTTDSSNVNTSSTDNRKTSRTTDRNVSDTSSFDPFSVINQSSDDDDYGYDYDDDLY